MCGADVMLVFADDVKHGITAHFVDQYHEVFDLALAYDPAEVSPHRPSEAALDSA